METAIEIRRVYWGRVRAAQRALGLPESSIAKKRRVRRVYQTIAFGPREQHDDVVLANIFRAMEWEPPLEEA